MSRQEDRRTVSIGRDIKNDIVIDNSSISRNHALITLVGDEYRLQDNNSLNGVFVNGRKVEFEIITPRDRITIGTEHTLDWSRIEKAFRSKAAEASQADLSGPSLTIGRDPDNDVVVENSAISRKHAKIYLNEVTGSGTSYYIKDLGSRNGLFVNGEKISSRRISPSDNITLGSMCQLNWQDIQAAQRRKFRSAPPPPPPPPPPLPVPIPKKSSNTGLWVALGVVFLILAIAGVFVLSTRIKPKSSQAILTSLKHRYSIKKGEPDEVAMRRANIEAKMALMEKTKENIPNNNNYVTNYVIFNVVVNGQSKDSATNEIVTDLSTEMDPDTFSQRMEQLAMNPEDFVSQLSTMQQDFDQNYGQVLINEQSLEDSYNSYTNLSGGDGYSDQGSSNDEYYQQCLDEYIGSVTSVEEVIDKVEGVKKEFSNYDMTSPVAVSGDPRQVLVDVINGNWSSKEELLGLHSQAYDSRELINITLEDSNTHQEQLEDICRYYLGIPEEASDIKISTNDIMVSYLSSTLAELRFTDQACQKIFEQTKWNQDYLDNARGYSPELDQSLDEARKSADNLNQLLTDEIKAPKYAIYEDGAWRLSQYIE